MNNTPVFIFDLGKVLVDFDYSIAARKVAAPEHLQHIKRRRQQEADDEQYLEQKKHRADFSE